MIHYFPTESTNKSAQLPITSNDVFRGKSLPLHVIGLDISNTAVQPLWNCMLMSRRSQCAPFALSIFFGIISIGQSSMAMHASNFQSMSSEPRTVNRLDMLAPNDTPTMSWSPVYSRNLGALMPVYTVVRRYVSLHTISNGSEHSGALMNDPNNPV